MEKKTKKEVAAKLEVICYNTNECDITIEGEKSSMIAALASLMYDNSEENEFHHMMTLAIALVLEKSRKEERKAARKKAKKAV